MKAAVVYGENDIRIVEVPTPRPVPQEVLIKVNQLLAGMVQDGWLAKIQKFQQELTGRKP